MPNINKSQSAVIAGIDELLREKWGEYFTFDRDFAEATGVVTLCWSLTGSPLPLNIVISTAALEKGHINWRELHRKIKLCLPDNVVKQKISEVNSLMRNANRRDLKAVETDIMNWIETTASDIQKVFGSAASIQFMANSTLPSGNRKGSIQDLHKRVEEKIDMLKELSSRGV